MIQTGLEWNDLYGTTSKFSAISYVIPDWEAIDNNRVSQGMIIEKTTDYCLGPSPARKILVFIKGFLIA